MDAGTGHLCAEKHAQSVGKMMSEREKSNPKGRMPSSGLKQTLRDLEKALDRWDELGSTDNQPVPNPEVSDDRVTIDQAEFKRKTRELLESLREQLESL